MQHIETRGRDLPDRDVQRPVAALAAWSLAGTPRPAADAGLINDTWIVVDEADAPCAVLQWVAPLFDPRIHHDIAAVTERLAGQGLETPRLVPTRGGALCLDRDDEPGVWRVLTYVPGTTIHRVESPATAAAAGDLVGRFHAALADWTSEFEAPPRHIHDTRQRMRDLEAALEGCDDHGLEAPARALGRRILDAWSSWDGTLDLPERPTHGDLKISNVRLLARGADGEVDEAVALIDLDTLGLLPLAVEMGDAWRSWCNRAGEDTPNAAALDLDLFAASARSWLATLEAQIGPLPTDERASLVPGIERIALELAARFCADAVQNSYFREDRTRHPEPGRHNLERARGQLNLAVDARAKRRRCEQLLETTHRG
ncbi:MAG: aminoglycoside phosphotransferase family protein [Acidobacteriota bacterium]